MNTPVISIIVPVYNVEPYLRQCLDSLINQTLRDIEIICVNDGSTDGSPAILQEYAARDERIRIVTQKNAGLSAARNSGMKVMRAPYVMFCDSDDWFEHNMCEVMYHALDSVNEASFAMCGTHVEWDYKASPKQILSYERWYSIRYSGLMELSAELPLHEFPAVAWNKIYRSTFLQEHHIQFPVGLNFEDIYFYNVYLAHATHMVFVQERLHHYRQRRGSIMYDESQKKANASVDRLRSVILAWNYYKEHGYIGKWDGYITKKWMSYLRIALKNEQTKKSRRYIVKVARDFVKENDEHTHALTDAQRSEIIKLINNACCNPTTRAMKYRLKKLCINLIPVAAWRRRLRRKCLSNR